MSRGGRQRPRPSNGTEEPRGSAVPRCFLGARLRAEPCPHRRGSRSTGELAAGEDTQSEDPLGVTAGLCPVRDKASGELGEAHRHGTCSSIPLAQPTTRSPTAVPRRAGRRVLLLAVPSEMPGKGSPCAAQPHPSLVADRLSPWRETSRHPFPPSSPNHSTRPSITCSRSAPASRPPGITPHSAGEVREGAHTWWLASSLSDAPSDFQFNTYFLRKFRELK